MAPRTISQIAGEFGLARGSSSDPFAQQEKAVLGNISRSLDDIRSQQLEGAQARGFGRSSFTEGAFARQTADVVGQVGQQFAQGRTQEALRETGFERDIITQELGLDRQVSLLGAQTSAEQELIGSRAQAETGLIGARGTEQRSTLADQLTGQQDLSTLQAGQRLEEQQAGGALEQQFIQARGAEQRAVIQEQTAGQEQLAGIRGAEDRRTSAQAQEAQIGAIGATGAQQSLLQAEQAQQTQALSDVRAADDITNINTQAANEIARAQADFTRIAGGLEEELRLKAEQQKDILVKELEVQREQKIADRVIDASLNYVFGKLQSPGGLGGGLGGVLDDLAGLVL